MITKYASQFFKAGYGPGEPISLENIGKRVREGVSFEESESPGGGGVMTLSLRVSATRIFKELPCFGVKFSNIHLPRSLAFFQGFFGGRGGKQNLLLCKFLLLC